jgi:hypothetical protein
MSQIVRPAASLPFATSQTISWEEDVDLTIQIARWTRNQLRPKAAPEGAKCQSQYGVENITAAFTVEFSEENF